MQTVQCLQWLVLALEDKVHMCFLKYITWHIFFLYLDVAFLLDSDLVVASPVEDYFLYIDDLPQSEKVSMYATLLHVYNFITQWRAFLQHLFMVSWQKEAERITRPVLDALGDDYSVCCQGDLIS